MITIETANTIAQRAYGRKGFCRPSGYSVNMQGQIIEGPRGYQIGYYRRGKKGARLSTEHGYGSTIVAAFADAVAKTEGLGCHGKLMAAYLEVVCAANN